MSAWHANKRLTESDLSAAKAYSSQLNYEWVCQMVHKYPNEQRPLFGMSVSVAPSSLRRRLALMIHAGGWLARFSGWTAE